MDVYMNDNPLRADDQFARAVLENAPACIKLLDLAGILTYLNPKGAEILELTEPGSAIGQDWISFWKGDDILKAKRAIKVAAAGGVGTFEGFYLTQANTPKWWDVTITSLTDEADKPTRLLVISRDITERHNAEISLVQKNAELERVIGELRDKQRTLDKTTGMLDSLLMQSRSYNK